ncbi:MAG TPA: hypothetical protein VGR62_22755 [Candidatus Binatia bacterium]|jgi:hypothetical protein|nr:hypothetical protein [Candidatus Binatia bacterium]
MMLGIGGLARVAGAQTLPTTPLAFAVFGLEGVHLGTRTTVQGDVGTNAGDVTLRRRASVEGSVGGEDIILRRGSRVSTALFCVQVQGGTKDCQRLPDPIVESVNLPVVQVSPGSENVTLRPRARRVPLEAGRWRDIRLSPHAELMLAGGVYSFRSLFVGRGSKLVCLAPCQIDVRGDVALGRRAQLELLAGAGGDGSISVQGAGTDGAFVAGRGAQITAAVYAPTGPVLIGPRARVVGSLVGRSVDVGPRSRLARSDG